MIFTVNYICKSKHIHDALFEPKASDLVIYFKEVKNIDITEEQLKYLDFDKIENCPEFENWAYTYGCKKQQKIYDDFYTEQLEKATKQIENNLSEEDLDELIEKSIKDNYLPSVAKTTLKRRANKMIKENKEE